MSSELQFLHEVFDDQVWVAVWMRPLTDATGTVTDFEFTYANEPGLRYLRFQREDLGRMTVCNTPSLTPELRQAVLEEMQEVYRTGVRSEKVVYNPALDTNVRAIRSRLRGGVLSTVQDLGEAARINWQLEDQTALADSILEASLSGTMACAAVRDAEGILVDFRIQRVNSAFTRLLGIPAEAAVGQVFSELFTNAHSSGILNRHKEVCSSGKAQTFEVHYKDHQLDAWYQIASSPLGDGVVITFLDITAEKEATTRIREQQQLLENILTHTSTGISVTEVIRDAEGRLTDGRTILANEAAVRYVGLPLEVYLSRTVKEIDPNIFDSPIYQSALHTLATGEPFQTQYYFEPMGRWLELTVNRMDSDRLINIFTDISAERKSALLQASLVEELKRSNESLEEFAYAASHDLQEPLRKIHYFSDRLKAELDGHLSDAQRNMFGRMEAASARMRKLIDDLLAYSRLSRATAADEVEAVDLNEAALLALQDLERAVQESGAQVQLDELPTVQGNARQLRQLWFNLFSNSIKYRKPGERPRILVRYGLEEGTHHFEVSDNGIGFDPEHTERIFLVFQRLHGRNEYEGTGVGLAIAQKVAQRHGGTLTAEGVPGKGATFRLRLPVSQAKAARLSAAHK